MILIRIIMIILIRDHITVLIGVNGLRTSREVQQKLIDDAASRTLDTVDPIVAGMVASVDPVVITPWHPAAVPGYVRINTTTVVVVISIRIPAVVFVMITGPPVMATLSPLGLTGPGIISSERVVDLAWHIGA